MRTRARPLRRSYFPLEFPISRAQWERYDLGTGVFPEKGEIRVPDFRVLRLIVKRIYERHDTQAFAHRAIKAGQLNATGLLNEIFRCIIRVYCETQNPRAFRRGLKHAGTQLPPGALRGTLERFVALFPPRSVLRGAAAPRDFLKRETGGIPNPHLATAEILLLSLANSNPALASVLELFSDEELVRDTAYPDLSRAIESYFRSQPGFGREGKAVIDFLREPIASSPESLHGQLSYIRDHWREYLPDRLYYRLLTALDLLKEEEKAGWLGAGPTQVLTFKGLHDADYPEYAKYVDSPEYDRFTEDRDWMSRVVLIAKSTYVWLDQLSKKYGRDIRRIDQIPDEELDTLSRWGFSGLWLIGVWERSSASRKIKRICGNPDALASAYSLYDYSISRDLGGEEAFRNLRDRARRRGLRLATDVVPNHTGIHSRWVIEHPERYIQLDHPPFPGYQFTGPDLSDDPSVAIQIEDGYWSRRDAAVVFRRRDKRTGGLRFIYHGNDGTSMPWNDTAQLDFLRADVREAVIATILDVARRFQIIRLDAAMTLAKKHFQRLWYPHPGTGGGIPSRAEHGMMRADFDRRMPHEFWREVVDRVTREMPDTLLLAEAFWMMEGYFVRTLGMHRVYNSAFMNMLKMEENDKYRSVVKNTLEFDPRILMRFVNFMNNPDELTAIEQFGNGDKYFGVCLMMVTMPGLPMFGHGQIEGFIEKYGMEYRRAYRNEQVDWSLVRRHEAEIFPLMKKRHLFSGVEHFALYDFFTPQGKVNENVFAYSNRSGGERAVVLYHNKYQETEGWIRTSCGMAVDYDDPGKKRVVQKTLSEALGLNDGARSYYIFRNSVTNLEHIRPGRELARQGIYAQLGAFRFIVYLDFREVEDGPGGYYGRLARSLGWRGVPSVEEAVREMILDPVHAPFAALAGGEAVERLVVDPGKARPQISKTAGELVRATTKFIGASCDARKIRDEIMAGLDVVAEIVRMKKRRSAAIEYLRAGLMAEGNLFHATAGAWVVTRRLGAVRSREDAAGQGVALMNELLLGKAFAAALRGRGVDGWTAAQRATLLAVLAGYGHWCDTGDGAAAVEAFRDLLNDGDARLYLGYNQYNGVLWFKKERMESLLFWLYAVSVLALMERGGPAEETARGIEERHGIVSLIMDAAEKSGCEVRKFVDLLPAASA
jgi:glycosidase